jgi:hypothetical protein
VEKCLFFNTNAINAERNSTSLSKVIWIQSNAPIAERKPCVIIRGICILRRVSKAKNAQGIAKPVAVVDKNSSKRGGNSPPRSFLSATRVRARRYKILYARDF